MKNVAPNGVPEELEALAGGEENEFEPTEVNVVAVSNNRFLYFGEVAVDLAIVNFITQSKTHADRLYLHVPGFPVKLNGLSTDDKAAVFAAWESARMGAVAPKKGK